MPKKPRKYIYARLLESDSIRLLLLLLGRRMKFNVGSAMIDFQGLSDMRPYPTSQMTSYAMDAACKLRQTSKPLCIVEVLPRSLEGFGLMPYLSTKRILKSVVYKWGLMSDVYGKTQRVVVWLGESADRSDTLFDVLADFDPSLHLREYDRYWYKGEEVEYFNRIFHFLCEFLALGNP